VVRGGEIPRAADHHAAQQLRHGTVLQVPVLRVLRARRRGQQRQDRDGQQGRPCAEHTDTSSCSRLPPERRARVTCLQRYRLRAFLATSLWIVPVLGVVLALAAAPALRRIDAATRWTLFGFGPDGARAVLGGLVASVFTFVVFVFTILLVAVQIASANLTPRVIAGILAHRPMRVSLGLQAGPVAP